MTELFGRLAPGATLKGPAPSLEAVSFVDGARAPESYSARARVGSRSDLRDQLSRPHGRSSCFFLRRRRSFFVSRVERRQPDSGPSSARIRAGRACRARRQPGRLRRTLLAEPRPLRRGQRSGLLARPLVLWRPAMAARFSCPRAGGQVDGSVLWLGAGWPWRRQCCSRMYRGSPPSTCRSALSPAAAAFGSRRHEPPSQDLRSNAIACSFLLLVAPACWSRR